MLTEFIGSLPGRSRSFWLHAVALGLGVIAPVVTFMVNAGRTPDYTEDEVLYTVIGQHIINNNSVSAPLGPLVVHPPVFFLASGAWQVLVGHVSSPVMEALTATRFMNADLCILIVWLTAIAVGRLRGPIGRYSTPVLVMTAMLLASTAGLFLRFGRTVLIEPLAVTMGLLILLMWMYAKDGPLRRVVWLGILIGVGCLVKQTVVFAALTPLLGSIFLRNKTQFKRAASAGGISVLVWWVFPAWAAMSDLGNYFFGQELTSLKRLLGLLQVTGINKSGDSPVTLLVSTLGQFATSYVLLILGALGLLSLGVRTGMLRRLFRTEDEKLAYLAAYCLLAYAFVGYSFLFGQGNEQLTMYAIPAACLLVVLPGTYAASPLISKLRIVPGLLAVCIVWGIASWMHYFAFQADDGTARMADFIAKNIHSCTQINATGDADRWQVAIETQQVTGYADGAQALHNHVHYFLLSPKDARNSYGNSSPELAEWIKANGTLVHTEPSVSYEQMQLWLVGHDEGAPQRLHCALGYPPPEDNASAIRFVALLASLCFAVGLLAWLGERHTRHAELRTLLDEASQNTQRVQDG